MPEDGFSTSAQEAVMQAFHERVEKECIGAWRAGYQYLDVLVPAMVPVDKQRDPLGFRAAFIPTDSPTAEYGDHVTVERYEVGALDHPEHRAKLEERRHE